jgi:hypothetical protein
MPDDAERKTLLEWVVESLQDELRQAYEAAPRKGSQAHEILRLLWPNTCGIMASEA